MVSTFVTVITSVITFYSRSIQLDNVYSVLITMNEVIFVIHLIVAV